MSGGPGADDGARGPAGGPPADEEAAAIALAGLPGIGPVSLTHLLRSAGGPREAWEAILDGRLERPGSVPVRTVPWALAARRADPARRRDSALAAGIATTWLGRPDYPRRLVSDPLPPPVLFWRGELGALRRPCVAVIGTRHCTPSGARLAWELARDLASSGVCVVSGLALGIDGRAHLGAITAGVPGATVGIAASGVDVAYPRRHAALWERVVECGAVISETAPGGPAQRWRFPARNRVIAGLVELVVVVESHVAGGSLLTVESALQRGVEVRAVPGPVGSAASEGSNQLLVEGAGPVRSAADVLDALGDFRPPSKPVPAGPGHRSGRPTSLAPGASRVLEAVGWIPTSLNQVVGTAALPLGVVSAHLEQLAAAGLVVEERGWWQRRGG